MTRWRTRALLQNGRAALPLLGSDGNQLDGLVAFICWRAAFGGRASCCSDSAWPEIRWPPISRCEASRRHDSCCSGPAVYGGTLPENGARLAHLLAVPGRCRHPDRAEMGPATRLENRPDPMANSAQAKRTGRHPDLRLSRRSPAHDAAHSAVQDRGGVCQTRRPKRTGSFARKSASPAAPRCSWICPWGRKALPPMRSSSRNSGTASPSRSRRVRAAHYTGVVRRRSFA